MTLVELANTAKILIRLAILLVIVYILYLIITPAAIRGFRSIFPDKNEPTPVYGQLPPLEFVEKPVSNSNPEYELNTVNGRLPGGFPEKMVVVRTTAPPFSYEAGKNAQAHAQTLGYTEDELLTDLKGTVYRWRDKQTGGLLDIDTTTLTLFVDTPLAGKSSLFRVGGLSESSAKARAIQMFTSIDRLTDTFYKTGTQTVTFGKITGTLIELVPTSQQAQLAQVDFFREIYDYPVLGPDPKIGLVNTLVKSEDSSMPALNFPRINYTQWEAVDDKKGTYPIITVSEAWNAVSNENKGVVVSVIPIGSSIFSPIKEQRVDKILIKDIYLAYYDTPTRQSYLQPIYVFEGEYTVSNRPGGTITIYFPAIQGQYIKGSPVAEPKS